MPTADDFVDLTALAALSERDRETLAGFADAVTVAAGERFFDEGEPANSCWLIRSGMVTLHTEHPGRGRRVVQTLGPGDVLGWSWLVPPYRWRLSATAASPVSAVHLDAFAVRTLAERDRAFGYALLIGLLGALLPRLHGTRARLLDLYGNSHVQ